MISTASPMASPPPNLTLTERDRRWRLVRSAMAEAEVDCLLSLADSHARTVFQPDTRYLTTAGGSGERGLSCVCPLDGDVVLITKRAERWPTARDWVTMRDSGGVVAPVVDQLRQTILPRRRVAITGGFGPDSAPEDVVAALHDTFPDVTWVDFATQMQAIRAVKSAEEIALLRHSTAIVERAIEQTVAQAQPGASDQAVWGAMIGELCRAGSEIPTYSQWGSGMRPIALAQATHATLHRGYLIVNEIEAVYAGYHARGLQPIAVQDCDPVFKELFALEAGFWETCRAELRLGRPLGEVAAACEAAAAAMLPATSRYKNPSGRLILHGLGLGHDLPEFAGHATEANSVVPEGAVFVLQPSLRIELGNRRYEATWGDSVVMRATGPERLGKRPPGLAIAPTRAGLPQYTPRSAAENCHPEAAAEGSVPSVTANERILRLQ